MEIDGSMKTNIKTIRSSFRCCDALEVSLSIEKQGLLFYDTAAKSATNPRVQAVFSRLANEEKDHIQSIQNKARFLQPAIKIKSSARTSQIQDFIKNELEGRVFPSSAFEKDGSRTLNDFEAINIGIEAEKRSIEILNQLIGQEKKMDVRMIFNHLLAEEKKHLMVLEELKLSCKQT